MRPMPADSPSMLSSRLKALVTPTSQARVISWSSADTSVMVRRTPPATTAAVMTSCARNLTCGRSGLKSSSRPTPASTVAPMTSIQADPDMGGSSGTTARTAPVIARPPMSGMVPRCQRSSLGVATAPTILASGLTA